MKFTAHVTVTLRPSILDPQGKATQHALTQLNFTQVGSVRIGKFIALEIDAASEDEARQVAEKAAGQLLANPVMEDFHVVVHNAS
jgi:phosphoribosylformylglycinamidine synthase